MRVAPALMGNYDHETGRSCVPGPSHVRLSLFRWCLQGCSYRYHCARRAHHYRTHNHDDSRTDHHRRTDHHGYATHHRRTDHHGSPGHQRPLDDHGCATRHNHLYGPAT